MGGLPAWGALSGELVELPWLTAMSADGRGFPRKSAGLPMTLRRVAGGLIGTSLDFSEGHTSYPGVVHGGVLATVVDQLMGDVVAVQRQVLAFSVTLHVRMLSPVLVGHAYLATAQVTGDAGGVIFTAATITCAAGETYVAAKGSFRPIRVETARSVLGLSIAECERLSPYFHNEEDPEVRQQ